MSNSSKHPFDVEATQEDLDQYMIVAARGDAAAAEFIHDWEIAHDYRVRDSGTSGVTYVTDKAVKFEQSPSQAAVSAQVSAKLPDGTTFTGTAQEVAAAVGAQLTRNLEAKRQQQNDPPRDSRTGRFTADQGRNDETEALRVAAAAELELRWKRGEITGSQYLEESGAIDTYLASKGVDLAAHQAKTQADHQYVQSWADAATKFMQGEGHDWPGDPDGRLRKYLMETMSKIYNVDLNDESMDFPDKVDAMARTWKAIKIETEMSKENDPSKMEELRERYRQEVMGRSSSPRYNQ